MVTLDTLRALHEHHQLAAYCATCERWAVLDLERLIAEGRGEYCFVGRKRGAATVAGEAFGNCGSAVIRELVGEVRVEVDETEIRLISRHAGIARALARAAGAPLQTNVVAGGRY